MLTRSERESLIAEFLEVLAPKLREIVREELLRARTPLVDLTRTLPLNVERIIGVPPPVPGSEWERVLPVSPVQPQSLVCVSDD